MVIREEKTNAVNIICFCHSTIITKTVKKKKKKKNYDSYLILLLCCLLTRCTDGMLYNVVTYCTVQY